MNSKEIVSDNSIMQSLMKYGFDHDVDEGRLLLAELLIKASAGYYNSHTEELFLSSFFLQKMDRTPNKDGRKFLCCMFYNSSNMKPESFELMKKYRQ